jgi:hypothetical protein
MRLAWAEIFDPSEIVAVQARRCPNLGRYRSRSAVVDALPKTKSWARRGRAKGGGDRNPLLAH